MNVLNLNEFARGFPSRFETLSISEWNEAATGALEPFKLDLVAVSNSIPR